MRCRKGIIYIFVQLVTAAWNVSFNNTLYAAVCFILLIMFHRHATSSERSAPTFPSRGRHSGRHFIAKYILFAAVLLLSRSIIIVTAAHQRRGTKIHLTQKTQHRRTTPRYNIPPVAINGFKSLNMARDVQPVYKRYPAVRRETDLAIYSHSARPLYQGAPTHHTTNSKSSTKINVLTACPISQPTYPPHSEKSAPTQSGGSQQKA